MNLHQIVRGAITSVNPDVLGTVRVSTGKTTLASGKQVPTYDTYENVVMQVQAMTYGDLRQIDGLNLNGTRRAIYFNGRADGVVRSLMKGGDLVTLFNGPNAGVWLIAHVLEQWPDWVKVCVTLQNEDS